MVQISAFLRFSSICPFWREKDLLRFSVRSALLFGEACDWEGVFKAGPPHGAIGYVDFFFLSVERL